MNHLFAATAGTTAATGASIAAGTTAGASTAETTAAGTSFSSLNSLIVDQSDNLSLASLIRASNLPLTRNSISRY